MTLLQRLAKEQRIFPTSQAHRSTNIKLRPPIDVQCFSKSKPSRSDKAKRPTTMEVRTANNGRRHSLSAIVLLLLCDNPLRSTQITTRTRWHTVYLLLCVCAYYLLSMVTTFVRRFGWEDHRRWCIAVGMWTCVLDFSGVCYVVQWSIMIVN